MPVSDHSCQCIHTFMMGCSLAQSMTKTPKDLLGTGIKDGIFCALVLLSLCASNSLRQK